MLTKSDRKAMADMETALTGDAWHIVTGSPRYGSEEPAPAATTLIGQFIPAALADLDAKDELLARVMKFEWSGREAHEDELNTVCPACGNEPNGGHNSACVFAEIAEHLEGVRGGTEDG